MNGDGLLLHVHWFFQQLYAALPTTTLPSCRKEHPQLRRPSWWEWLGCLFFTLVPIVTPLSGASQVYGNIPTLEFMHTAAPSLIQSILPPGSVSCPHEEPTSQLALGFTEAECLVPGKLQRANPTHLLAAARLSNVGLRKLYPNIPGAIPTSCSRLSVSNPRSRSYPRY